jgi:multiple sugar transport system ATP-binding protein
LAASGAALVVGDNGRGFTVPLTASARRAAAHAGRELLAGVRPEHLGEASGSGAATVESTVEFVEQLGDEGIVHVRAGTSPLLGRLDAHAAPRPGERITLRFDPARLHLFDAETEKRLPD